MDRQGTKPVVLTLAERRRRKSLYVLVENKTQKEVAAAIKWARRRADGNFDGVFESIMADNGSGFLNNEAVKKPQNAARTITRTHAAAGNAVAARTATVSFGGSSRREATLAS
ncbi:MAG: hypothetical protein LBQ15_07495 [Clostridium sp.]|nr:hypothetical protein [Clostridium sp.]